MSSHCEMRMPRVRKVRGGFPSPYGSKRSTVFCRSGERNAGGISASMVMVSSPDAGRAISSTREKKESRNRTSRARSMLNPAAKSCPPWVRKSPACREKKSAMTLSRLHRIDPTAVSSDSAMKIAGVLKNPCSRDAALNARIVDEHAPSPGSFQGFLCLLQHQVPGVLPDALALPIQGKELVDDSFRFLGRLCKEQPRRDARLSHAPRGIEERRYLPGDVRGADSLSQQVLALEHLSQTASLRG